MSTASTPSSTKRALVLGGGGSAGNAWLIGIIAGLYDAGIDVTKADVIIGTSAGSTAAAQITSANPSELYAATIAPLPPRPAVTGPGSASAERPAANHSHVDRLSAAIATSTGIADLRRRLGTAALAQAAASDGSWPAQWRAMVALRLPGPDWPEQSVLITAVDAETGEPVVFDRHSGVDLVDAVAASCSSSLPYPIGDHQYIDGGYRTNAENADLATGYDRVVILSPFGGRSLQPAGWGTHLSAQVDALRGQGSQVQVVSPDGAATDIFGPGGNVMDPSTRRPAAQAGYEQGKALAADLAEFDKL